MNIYKKRFTIMFILLTMILLSTTIHSYAEDSQVQSASTNLEPPAKLEKKFRIGFVEGDPFVNFTGTLHGIILGLEQYGWITDTSTIPYQLGQEDSKVIWDWLQDEQVSPYIEFVHDAFYNLRFMSEEEINQMLDRMKNKRDLDLVIVMGTRSGVIMSSIEHDTPFMAFSVTDAVSAGIVQAADHSGFVNRWAHMDPERTKRQIRVFHDIFEFSKMGIVYENTPSGRSLIALEDIFEVAKERNIELIERHVSVPKNDADYERYYHDLMQAHEQLAKEVDVMYLTYGDWEINVLPRLIEPFIKHSIPTFSQTGAEEVESGVLISVSRADFTSWGKFGAENIIKALNGSSLNDLPQILEDTPGIALNLNTANQIGYKVPFDILLVADEIYQSAQ